MAVDMEKLQRMRAKYGSPSPTAASPQTPAPVESQPASTPNVESPAIPEAPKESTFLDKIDPLANQPKLKEIRRIGWDFLKSVERKKFVGSGALAETIFPLPARWYLSRAAQAGGYISGQPETYEEYRQFVDDMAEGLYAMEPGAAKAGKYIGWGANIFNIGKALISIPRVFGAASKGVSEFFGKLSAKHIGAPTTQLEKWAAKNLPKIQETLNKPVLQVADELKLSSEKLVKKLFEYRKARNQAYQNGLMRIARDYGDPKLNVGKLVSDLEASIAQQNLMTPKFAKWHKDFLEELAKSDGTMRTSTLIRWKQKLNALRQPFSKRATLRSTPESKAIAADWNGSIDDLLGTVGKGEIREINKLYSKQSNTLDVMENFIGRGTGVVDDAGKYSVEYTKAPGKLAGTVGEAQNLGDPELLEKMALRIGPEAMEVLDDFKAALISDQLRLGGPPAAIYLTSGGDPRGRVSALELLGTIKRKGAFHLGAKVQTPLTGTGLTRAIQGPAATASRIGEAGGIYGTLFPGKQ